MISSSYGKPHVVVRNFDGASFVPRPAYRPPYQNHLREQVELQPATLYSLPTVNMPHCRPASAPRAKSTKKRNFFDDPMNSKDCRVPTPLPSERHALPTPSSFRRTEALDDIESDDYLKIRAALARIDTEIEAKALLDQLDKPERPKWQTMLNDWVSVKIPQALFKEWEARLQKWEHLYFEYNPSTERMLIKCMTSKIYNAVPNNFQRQAVMEVNNLNPAAQKLVEIGTNDGMSYPKILKPSWVWKLILFKNFPISAKAT